MTPNAGVCSKNDLAGVSSRRADMVFRAQVATSKTKNIESGSERIMATLDRKTVCSVVDVANWSRLHAKTVAYHAFALEQVGLIQRTRWGRETLLHRSERSSVEAIVHRLFQDPVRQKMLRCLVQRRVPQVELAHAAGSMHCTAHRFLRELQARGLVQTSQDPSRVYWATRTLIEMMHIIDPEPV